MQQVSILVGMLDGKTIAFSSETNFYVQVGRGKKGSYKTRYFFKADLSKAVFHYNCINIGNGYKKRLRMTGCSKALLKYSSA